MADFPYTTVPGKLSEILAKVKSVGVPEKTTTQWLKSIGFKSSNDTSLLSVLKFIDFSSSAGAPTQRWKNYRGANSKEVLGDAIRHGYKELYEVYPAAHQCSDDELTSFFSTKLTAGAQAISKTVSTFKSLYTIAEFSGSPSSTPSPITPPNPVGSPPAQPPSVPTQPEVHIDVQIHISSDSSAVQIDQIFASMSKHLYGRDDTK